MKNKIWKISYNDHLKGLSYPMLNVLVMKDSPGGKRVSKWCFRPYSYICIIQNMNDSKNTIVSKVCATCVRGLVMLYLDWLAKQVGSLRSIYQRNMPGVGFFNGRDVFLPSSIFHSVLTSGFGGVQ